MEINVICSVSDVIIWYIFIHTVSYMISILGHKHHKLSYQTQMVITTRYSIVGIGHQASIKCSCFLEALSLISILNMYSCFHHTIWYIVFYRVYNTSHWSNCMSKHVENITNLHSMCSQWWWCQLHFLPGINL